jgi:hypothetical protein
MCNLTKPKVEPFLSGEGDIWSKTEEKRGGNQFDMVLSSSKDMYGLSNTECKQTKNDEERCDLVNQFDLNNVTDEDATNQNEAIVTNRLPNNYLNDDKCKPSSNYNSFRRKV